MFGWFKKKSTPQSEAVCQKLLQFQKPMILVQALAEEISEYYKAVKSGKSSAPAYQRKDDSVVGIWRDTRLEVLRQLWGYGASEPTLLADRFQQKKLLYAFFENKPQYEYSHQPSGDPLHDTLQALFHVYLLLEKAGTAVGDKETDGLFLKCVAKKTIFSDFEEDAKVLRTEWTAFEQAVHGSGGIPAMPCTLLEILYKDVTRKTKTIALSAQFGPDYQTNMNDLVNRVEEQMHDQGKSQESINKKMEQLRSTYKKLLAADEPDHLT
jgi:hypothetical protein